MDLKRGARIAAERVVARVDPTVAQGWDIWARRHKKRNAGTPLGQEWNEPQKIGLDVEADEIVAYLDRELFAPFLDGCETIVEIGPGGGRFTEILLPKCLRLIAVEASPNMLDLLRDRFAHESKIQYALTAGADLPGVPDDSIDGVFSYDVFVHLQHWDFYHYLTEIRRVLHPGGKAVLHHANTFSGLGWDKFVGDMHASVGKHKLPWTFTVMTPSLMEQFCEAAGLRVVNTVTGVVKRDGITFLERPAD